MNLQAGGTTGLPTLMSLMRHSDPKLTAKTYTDPMMLQKAEAVRGLPSFLEAGGKWTEKWTGRIVKKGLNGSSSVHLAATGTEDQNSDNHSGISSKVGTCPDVSANVKWLRRQDSNLLQTAQNKGIRQGGTGKGTGPETLPADLQAVVAAWPSLADSLKAAVLAVVRSAKGGRS